MKILSLIEDSPGRPGCIFEHGLSIYVETHKHKLLLDTGATGAFVKNAEALGVDLSTVDTVVLSHGHYDHAGGILAFAEINKSAPVYMQSKAYGDYYHGERYIGIDSRIPELPQVKMVDGDYRLDEELYVFTGVSGRRLWPQSNLELTRRFDGQEAQDDFVHEQYLVISQDGLKILLSGCAHNGILNILDRYKEMFHSMPDVVISGFHMKKKKAYSENEIADIKETARELVNLGTVFYTGHCTGQDAFDIMKGIMGDKLRHVKSGMELLL